MGTIDGRSERNRPSKARWQQAAVHPAPHKTIVEQKSTRNIWLGVGIAVLVGLSIIFGPQIATYFFR
ncbi:hypothetical protein KW800_03070 [Candidatus Parcubacteria bacterium]|nr:hypothetical protein [Candidatus Parcubacteria bacterium]